MPFWMSMGFQDSNSWVMMGLSFFHEHCLTYIILILMITGLMTITSAVSSSFRFASPEHNSMEMFWSIVPSFILLMIVLPSMEKLYATEDHSSSALVISAIGHQWYWSYEYSDSSSSMTDSYIEDSLHRLIMADSHLILPIGTNVQVLTTSADVIHSWTVPSLGVKADAIPGRVNQMYVCISRPGVMVGQCSEICGANHSFMPITVSALTVSKFLGSINF